MVTLQQVSEVNLMISKPGLLGLLSTKGKQFTPGTSYGPQKIFTFMRPEGLILDLGCGGGGHALYLIQEGFRVIGCDINLEELEESTVNEVVCANAMELPFRDESFDSVLCTEVLEHLPAPEQCIKEVHRILRVRGIACFTTPCLNIPIKALVPVYRKLAGIDPEKSKEHLHVFSSKRLITMLTPFFEIDDIYYTNFTGLLKYRAGHGYSLDAMLSAWQRKAPLLRYLAGSVFIRVVNRETMK